MFKKKIDGLFNDIPSVFGNADDILIAGFDADSMGHDVSLEQVLCRCRQPNLLNKEKCLFKRTCIPFFGEVISRHGVSPDPAKVKALIDMLPPKPKRKPQPFPVIVIYLSKLPPMTAHVCKPHRRLTSVNLIGHVTDHDKRYKNSMKSYDVN